MVSSQFVTKTEFVRAIICDGINLFNKNNILSWVFFSNIK